MCLPAEGCPTSPCWLLSLAKRDEGGPRERSCVVGRTQPPSFLPCQGAHGAGPHGWGEDTVRLSLCPSTSPFSFPPSPLPISGGGSGPSALLCNMWFYSPAAAAAGRTSMLFLDHQSPSLPQALGHLGGHALPPYTGLSLQQKTSEQWSV